MDSYRGFPEIVYPFRVMTRFNIRKVTTRCLDSTLDIMLPRFCVMCGFSSGSQNLCQLCLAELPRITLACPRCALPLRPRDGENCDHCLARNPPWTSAIAALVYRFPVNQLVCRFKFSKSLSCGCILGNEIIRAVRAKRQEPPDCLVPVPLHRTRHFVRSFNQADILARQAGKALGIPVCSTFMSRRKRTRAHSGLNASTRSQNIHGAFSCKIPKSKRTFSKHVALVDDVLTTGATLAECTRELKKAGVGRVSVWVAARAPKP